MVKLFDAESGEPLGSISEDQLEYLMSELEEESTTDRDYYVDAATVDMLEEDGADPELIGVLRGILEEREGRDIRWEQS
jgi:processive 1,2-diacylglycerol beta-glucosyltransferase